MIKIMLSTKLGEKKMCQAELARRTGIRPNTINDLYHEITDRISLKQLDQICRVLGCEVGDLIVRIPEEDCKKCIHYTKTNKME